MAKYGKFPYSLLCASEQQYILSSTTNKHGTVPERTNENEEQTRSVSSFYLFSASFIQISPRILISQHMIFPLLEIWNTHKNLLVFYSDLKKSLF